MRRRALSPPRYTSSPSGARRKKQNNTTGDASRLHIQTFRVRRFSFSTLVKDDQEIKETRFKKKGEPESEKEVSSMFNIENKQHRDAAARTLHFLHTIQKKKYVS